MTPTEQVLEQLKDFQLTTVDYVFDRLYGADNVNRFLMADEVGLGKTLVARGLTAKTIDHLQAMGTKRVDVVYVCSNQAIAAQNLNRLRLPGSSSFTNADRLTLLPMNLKRLAADDINFVAFTPGTSFDLKGAGGKVRERALLFVMLRDIWKGRVMDRPGVRPAMTMGAKESTLSWNIDRVYDHGYDPGITKEFGKALAERPEIRECFMNVTRKYARKDRRNDQQLIWERRDLIGELRELLAATCVDALEPDLVILDEFQRFRDLLDDDGPLTKPLFNFTDHDTGENVRLLLLSATPYKMYTSAEDDEDHYADFARTVEFLLERDTGTFSKSLEDFRNALRDGDDPEALTATKRAVEAILRRVMARTERATVGLNGSMTSDHEAPLRLEATDLQQYLAVAKMADHVEAPDIVEYWKSVPFFANFMDEYSMARQWNRLAANPDTWPAAKRIVRRRSLLSSSQIRDYRPVGITNARHRWLDEMITEKQLWRLLWLPPTLPYYDLQDPFKGRQSVTKHLVFSAWRAVPKAVTALVSYEIERKLVEGSGREVKYRSFSKDIAQRLTFRRADGRPASMSALTLIYPSPTLARIGDPRRVAAQIGSSDLSVIRREVADRISDELEPWLRNADKEGRVDPAWYWAAAGLLDRQYAGWLGQTRHKTSGSADQEDSSGYDSHLDLFLETIRDGHDLGRPPEDLAERLADMAIGAPANAALRALAGIVGTADLTQPALRHAAFDVAWEFRNMVNRSETIMVVEDATSDVPYWQQVIEYASAGCLQAVFDDYAHMLIESLGLFDRPLVETVEGVAKGMTDAMNLRSGFSLGHDPARLNADRKPQDIRFRTISPSDSPTNEMRTDPAANTSATLSIHRSGPSS